MSEPDDTPAANGTQNGDIGSQERLAHALTPDTPGTPNDNPQPDMPTRLGRFEVRAILGNGAFGRVYLAFDPEMDREVAIKVPLGNPLTSEDRERFLREAKATSKIHHPHICPVYDVGVQGGQPYIVMKFVPGGNLAKYLASLSEPLPPQDAIEVVGRLASGLAAAHEQGVIHRDIKPANVLYNAAQKELLLTDFGLARLGFDARLSQAGAGTPAYMAPEQFRRKADMIGPQSDIYSLGVVLYEMLTGRVPFAAEDWFDLGLKVCEDTPIPPSTVRLSLDPRLDALCLKALEKKPADRYESAKAFAAALAAHLRSGPSAVSVETHAPLKEEVAEPATQKNAATEDENRTLAAGYYQRGNDYYFGRGVPQDYVQARELWEKAAARGYAVAQIDLGALYERGHGVTQDRAKAREYYEKASALGHAGGTRALARLDVEDGKAPPAPTETRPTAIKGTVQKPAPPETAPTESTRSPTQTKIPDWAVTRSIPSIPTQTTPAKRPPQPSATASRPDGYERPWGYEWGYHRPLIGVIAIVVVFVTLLVGFALRETNWAGPWLKSQPGVFAVAIFLSAVLVAPATKLWYWLGPKVRERLAKPSKKWRLHSENNPRYPRLRLTGMVLLALTTFAAVFYSADLVIRVLHPEVEGRDGYVFLAIALSVCALAAWGLTFALLRSAPSREFATPRSLLDVPQFLGFLLIYVLIISLIGSFLGAILSGILQVTKVVVLTKAEPMRSIVCIELVIIWLFAVAVLCDRRPRGQSWAVVAAVVVAGAAWIIAGADQLLVPSVVGGFVYTAGLWLSGGFCLGEWENIELTERLERWKAERKAKM